MSVPGFVSTLRIATAGILLAAGILGAASPARAAETAAPAAAKAVVEDFHAVLLDVMKRAKSLGLKGRFERLEPEVARHMNLRVMTAIVTGAAWTKASEAERERAVESFHRFFAANFATRFDGFSGQSFETVSVAPGPRGTMMVSTRILRPNDSPVKLTYVTRPAKDGAQIVDVLVDDGISELAVRRSEYSRVLADSGMTGLVAEIDGRSRALLAAN